MSAAEKGVLAPQVEVGRTIGRYTILSRIAGGGMAEVWLAELRGIEEFRRRVVLKTIRPHLARRPEYVKMFITEAQTAARLNHPNVVPVFDLGCTDDVYFMAMEYVPGRSLREIAKRATPAKVPAWAVLHAVSETCKGLQYVHDYADETGHPLGLVHCDVSPDNVIVSFTGNVTLVDFGIVECAGASDKDPDLIKGKSRYIAPERLRGTPMDRRGDIYAVGVMLYELLTGSRIYEGQACEVMVHAAFGRPRPPRELCPEMPSPLEEIILRAASASPDDRFPEAHLLRAALLAQMPARPEPAARGYALAQYVSSLFPDASDIPFDLRRGLQSGRPVPHSYIRVTASRPLPPPEPPLSERETEPEDDDHLSIDLLDELSEELPDANGGPPTLPSVTPVVYESGTHLSLDPREVPPRPAMPPPLPPPPKVPASREGPWTPRPRNPTLIDVFAVTPFAQPPGAADVFTYSKATTAKPAPKSEPPPAPRPAETQSTRQAARHFDAGLRLCRERRYGAALAEWEAATELDPEQSLYRTNLKKLKARLQQKA
ncbi:MAG TPA: serine/threonine-protein kinase [Polyangiaceae bacterium]|jgi:serine/threonine-protein kinase